MKYTFIDIGCGHTDVSTDTYGLNVNGLLVEPIKEFCDVLPNSDTVLIEQSAVGEYNGIIDIHCDLDTKENKKPLKYFSIEQINSVEKLKTVLKTDHIYGTSSIIHNGQLYSRNFPIRKVNLITLESLINKYNITEVDQFKIDVEGYENIILQQLIELMENNKLVVNKRIIFEYNDLSNLKKLDELKLLISEKFGFNYLYKALAKNRDIIMEKIW